MRAVDLETFRTWLERYFAAWASNEPAEVEALFAQDAVYSWGPFRDDAVGRDAIITAWIEGGAPPGLGSRFEVLAVTGDRGVAHWNVSFADGAAPIELDGILVCDFDADGRCTLHREWYDRREPTA